MNYSAVYEIDIHGMTRAQAQTAIDAVLRRAKGAYRIRVVHGYHGGTVLRDLARSYIKDKRVIRTELGLNPSITDLILKEF